MVKDKHVRLNFMRAYIYALTDILQKELTRIESYRNTIVVLSTPVAFTNGRFLSIVIKSDFNRNTTTPYCVVFPSNAANVNNTLSEIIDTQICTDGYSAIKCEVNDSDSSYDISKRIRQRFNTYVNLENNEQALNAIEPNFNAKRPSNMVKDILAETENDVLHAISSLDPQMAANFNFSTANIVMPDGYSLLKQGNQFVTADGFVFTVYGFNPMNNSCYSSAIDFSYNLKRESKRDNMY